MSGVKQNFGSPVYWTLIWHWDSKIQNDPKKENFPQYNQWKVMACSSSRHFHNCILRENIFLQLEEQSRGKGPLKSLELNYWKKKILFKNVVPDTIYNWIIDSVRLCKNGTPNRKQRTEFYGFKDTCKVYHQVWCPGHEPQWDGH